MAKGRCYALAAQVQLDFFAHYDLDLLKMMNDYDYPMPAGMDVMATPADLGRLIATLHDPAVIRTILAHLALCHSGQSPGPAPPESGAGEP